ncbi:Cell division control protein 42 [Mycena sanguinolenta]|uniref:Cell division control protein 42 n=1 Tax=Mycena sanguinolenta TaxID=230812 RepID=A0A8H6XNH1_9AGAR|nr:Cell division control protein 42 [Mycena sanguinolenta]
MDNTIKVVLIGDGATALCITYSTGNFPADYIPTVFDGWAGTITIGTEPWIFGLFDSAGQSEYDHLRPLAYPQTDVFVVCFSVGMLASFENVREKWFPETHHFCPGVPCIMVATQIDLRSDKKVVMQMARRGQAPVTTAQGERMAFELGAAKYLECSAKTLEGVKNVFIQARILCSTDISNCSSQAVAAAVPYALEQRRKSKRCIVL